MRDGVGMSFVNILLGRLGNRRVATEISLLILSLVENGFAHTVDILGALVLALTQIYVADHLTPPRLHVQHSQLLLQGLLLTLVLNGSIFLLLLLAGEEFV